MLINKWNGELHSYVPTFVPDEWNIKTFSCDMNEIVNCVNCGKKIKFGNGYTSRRWHTNIGMGYTECEACYFNYKKGE